MLLAALLALQPAPAASPEATPRFVFFDAGEAEIRREWNEVIAGAAAEALRTGGRISLAAHSDRSGSAAGNRRISRERLQVVRQALIAAGVPAERIAGTAYGEDQPLVPTADGVREIQNRRVAIKVAP